MKGALTAVVVAICAATAIAQTITRSVVTPDHSEPPTKSLSVLLSYADAVIVGQVTSQAQETGRVGERPHPLIRHKVKVLDVVKGPGTLIAGATIDIVQPGGTARLGDVEVTINDPSFPIFSVESKYVFILRASGSDFSSYSGPFSVIPIVGADRIAVSKYAEHFDDLRSHKNDSISGLLSLLRAKVQGGRSGGSR